MAENEIEVPDEAPPALGIFDGPRVNMPESEFYDAWGNLKGPPIKTVDEYHGDDFIKIFVYRYDDMSDDSCLGRPADYYFGFQIKIDKLVRQKTANIADKPSRSVDEARIEARDIIINICRKNRAIRRLFADFLIIRYNQPELF